MVEYTFEYALVVLFGSSFYNTDSSVVSRGTLLMGCFTEHAWMF